MADRTNKKRASQRVWSLTSHHRQFSSVQFIYTRGHLPLLLGRCRLNLITRSYMQIIIICNALVLFIHFCRRILPFLSPNEWTAALMDRQAGRRLKRVKEENFAQPSNFVTCISLLLLHVHLLKNRLSTAAAGNDDDIQWRLATKRRKTGLRSLSPCRLEWNINVIRECKLLVMQ